MKVGAEDKRKVQLLILLLIVAGVTVYVQFFSGDPAAGFTPPPQPAGARATTAADPATAARPARRAQQRQAVTPTRGREFEPIWRRSHEDETFDPLEADPTLQTYLLAKVREVGFDGVERNIFEFTTRKAKVEPPSPAVVAAAEQRQKEFEQQQAKAAETPAPKPAASAPKRAPRLAWKYYGFAARSVGNRPVGDQPVGDQRRAFLLNGDEVLIGGVGDVFNNRYKVVRIELTSIVIEDMDFKEEQSLPITVPQG